MQPLFVYYICEEWQVLLISVSTICICSYYLHLPHSLYLSLIFVSAPNLFICPYVICIFPTVEAPVPTGHNIHNWIVTKKKTSQICWIFFKKLKRPLWMNASKYDVKSKSEISIRNLPSTEEKNGISGVSFDCNQNHGNDDFYIWVKRQQDIFCDLITKLKTHNCCTL